MGYPVLNIKETYRNVDFLQAFQADNLWYSLPANNDWVYNNPTIVSGRTIINARKDLIVGQDILNEFSNLKGGVQIIPISPLGSNDNLSLNLRFSSEHLVKFNLIQDVPYPSLAFTATLNNSSSDYQTLLNDIQQKLIDNTILRGKIKISYAAINLQSKISITFNLRNILKDISSLSNSNIYVRSNLDNILYSYITKNFGNIVLTSYSRLSDIEKSIIIDYLQNFISNAIFNPTIDTFYFDRTMRYKQSSLRDPLEVSAADVKNDFFKTLQQTVIQEI